jgi:hypothetical protein
MIFLKQKFPKKKFEFLVRRDDGNIQIISLNFKWNKQKGSIALIKTHDPAYI